jgi:Family of unknown function (DUF6348)
MHIVNSELNRVFADHGVTLTESAGWLTTGGRLPACRASFQPPRTTQWGFSVRLDVEVKVDDNRTMMESFGDVGTTLDDAAVSSFSNFCRSSLHVLLSAFWNVHDEQQVLREEWAFHGRRWSVFVGNFVRKAADGRDVPIPPNLFGALEALLKSHDFSDETHWLRIYYASLKRSDQICEALLDNQPWEKCATMVRQSGWVPADFFYSSRLFLVLRPVA